jgi:hypothetical protein
MITVHKIRNEHPFIWLTQSVRFLNRNYGDILFATATTMILSFVLNMIPKVGWVMSQVVSTFLTYGVFRYLMTVESGEPAKLKLIFSVFRNQQAMTRLILWLIFSTLVLTFAGLVVVSIGAALLHFQGGYDLSNMPTETDYKTFVLDHWIEMPFVFVAGLLPILFFFGSVYFVEPLIAVGNQPLGRAIRLSFEANIKNWLPLTIFGLTFLMIGICLAAGVAGMLFFGGMIGRMFIGVAGMGFAIFVTLYLAPLYTVLGYATYLGIFEGRYLKFVPKPVVAVEPVAAVEPAVTNDTSYTS